jgi:hypothetical protein
VPYTAQFAHLLQQHQGADDLQEVGPLQPYFLQVQRAARTGGQYIAYAREGVLVLLVLQKKLSHNNERKQGQLYHVSIYVFLVSQGYGED